MEEILKLNLISWTFHNAAISDLSLLHFCYERVNE